MIKKAINIKILDLSGLSTVSDFFVIATGANRPHLKSLFEGLQLDLKNVRVYLISIALEYQIVVG